MSIPLIDIQPLLEGGSDKSQVTRKLARACRDHGFFYICGHGVSEDLQKELERLSWRFFRQPAQVKGHINMKKGGRAWRGYFSVGEELTSGKPDVKEGLYFGKELGPEDPRVKTGVAMHGSNLYPDLPGFRTAVRQYMESLTILGYKLMEGIALSLELPADYFKAYFQDPLTLFRIFHYPAPTKRQEAESWWGVGEHTDYGVLTILKQDDAGGLQVQANGKWVDAPFIENTFICNIGDMLDVMTRGYYRSTPHRVRNISGKGRLSFPFFFDPDFNARIEPVDLAHLGHRQASNFERWDGADLQAFSTTYGEYILGKVSKVFPQLKDDIL